MIFTRDVFPPRQSVTCGLQQGGVLRVITARDLELAAPDRPECRREHVLVDWCVRYISNPYTLIVPPLSTVFHPIFGIIVWESCNESPSLARSCHITISLPKKKNDKIFTIVSRNNIPKSGSPNILISVWVLNVSNNLVNKSCNTKGLARVVTDKCNEKGGPFFKDLVGV